MSEDRQSRFEDAVRSMLELAGENVDRPGLDDTPKRVAKMYLEELMAGIGVDLKAIVDTALFHDASAIELTPEGVYHEEGGMVIVKEIPFYSVCEHHLVPFHGQAHVGYISTGAVVGLSKIARVVEMASKRPQVQERITSEVAVALMDSGLKPEGVGVVLEAEHLCMAMRGIRKPGSITTTSAMLGSFRYERETRAEFLSLIK